MAQGTDPRMDRECACDAEPLGVQSLKRGPCGAAARETERARDLQEIATVLTRWPTFTPAVLCTVCAPMHGVCARHVRYLVACAVPVCVCGRGGWGEAWCTPRP
jgi:hypothetical protein